MEGSARANGAIVHGELELYQQRIVEFDAATVQRYELLLRVADGRGRSGSADRLIREAEHSGAIARIDRWVVRCALASLAAWQAAAIPVLLHVNLSGASLIDRDVVEFIQSEFDSSDANPAALTFEITETAAIGNYERAYDFADRLTDFGCSIAIDDYGSASSGEHYLEHLPFDLLKIDGSIVKRICGDEDGIARIAEIVETAAELGVRTVGEMVEDEISLAQLREVGVDMAQGFYLDRPGPITNGAARPA